MNMKKQVMNVFALLWLTALLGCFTLGPFVLNYVGIVFGAMILCIVGLLVIPMLDNLIFNYIISFITAFVLGTVLYSSIAFYATELGIGVVLSVIITCVIVFGLCAIIGLKSDFDFTSWGKILTFALIALIIFSLISYFFAFGDIVLAIASGFGVAIFIGYILYDFSFMRQFDIDRNEVPILAVSLFIDLLNLILQALKLVYHMTKIFAKE